MLILFAPMILTRKGKQTMDFFGNTSEEKLTQEVESRKSHTLWVEKFRPLSLDTFIGNTALKEVIKTYISSGDIPHLLFYGGPGCGKTTLANMLIKNIECDSMYINASDENSIDTIRDKVRGFATTTGFKELKISILDECLDENTNVWVLRNGDILPIQIKNLDEENDLVKCYNIEKNEIQYRPFDLHDIGESNVYELELENGEKIICTDTHKWYVEDMNGNTITVKTSDLINGLYTHILSK